ncbi:MAG: AEC family transporter, partial [Rhodospirillales bacterium]|nr:AEC family transporter [Rhodospirillales bacterium]
MFAILAALVPVFLLIVLGHLVRRFRLVPDAFWPPAEGFTYYLFFPALLLSSTAKAPLAGGAALHLALAAALATLGSALLVLALKRGLAVDGPSFTSVFQGAIRPNTYIGLAGALALFGKPGVALTAICVAVVVPLVNFLSVGAMLRFAHPSWPGWPALVKPTLANPLIGACLLGIALNLSGLGLPWGVGGFLDILGGASLPVGLLAVGAGLDLSALRRTGTPLLAAPGLTLLALPLAAFLRGRLCGLDPQPLGVLLLYT